MNLLEIEPVTRNSSLGEIPSSSTAELYLRKGNFVAVVQSHKSQYAFFVRDLRRERPTIHGFGVNLRQAMDTATQYLDALTATP